MTKTTKPADFRYIQATDVLFHAKANGDNATAALARNIMHAILHGQKVKVSDIAEMELFVTAGQ